MSFWAINPLSRLHFSMHIICISYVELKYDLIFSAELSVSISVFNSSPSINIGIQFNSNQEFAGSVTTASIHAYKGQCFLTRK
jgi:hypothetical protein